jgi:hypothetical protein
MTTVIMTPGENYREAQLLLAARFRECKDCPPNCAHEQAMVALAAVHAALAQCPAETYTEAEQVERGEPPFDPKPGRPRGSSALTAMRVNLDVTDHRAVSQFVADVRLAVTIAERSRASDTTLADALDRLWTVLGGAR